MSEVYEGSCQCGKVYYRVSGESINLFACHCMQCQKQSASAFGMALWISNYNIEDQTGNLCVWTRQTPSGFEMAAKFCSMCGTRVFHYHSANPDVISIKPGTLNDTTMLSPIAHIWTSQSQPWVIFPKGTRRYLENPPGFEEMTKAWHESK